MFYYVKWAFWICVLALFAALLHYSLPQYDTVRISDTYEKRVDPGNNSMFWSGSEPGSAAGLTSRDVFFIQAMRPNGKPIVYRNEDTGWGWPPLFKFDTSNLQARASDAKSTVEAPKWVAIRHYGWRNELLSIYPNAVGIKPVDGPDARVIPWGSLIVLAIVLMIIWAITSRIIRFVRRRIDPALDDASDTVNGWRARLRR